MGVKNPSGGLTKWVESEALYSGKYYARFIVAGTGNKDAVISPLGTGGFSLQQADGTAAGGNARGTYAIDLQLLRSTASQVASGYASSIGGTHNIITGSVSSCYGSTCTVSSSYSRADGESCFTTSSATYSSAQGYYADAYLFGSSAKSSSVFNTQGSTQRLEIVLSGNATGSTPVVLTSNLASAGTTNQLNLKNNQSKTFVAIVDAIVSGSTTRGASWIVKGRVSRGASAGTTVINGTPIVETIWNPDSCTLAVSADTTNGAGAFAFTGATGTDTRITAVITCAETIYA